MKRSRKRQERGKPESLDCDFHFTADIGKQCVQFGPSHRFRMTVLRKWRIITKLPTLHES